MSNYLVTLAAQKQPLSLVGGKAMNLLQLVEAKFPVPSGFILTTDAYHAFVESNQLQPEIESILKGIQVQNPSSFETASSQICALFEQAQMPEAIRAAIAAAYLDMTQGPVAVRSSATAEDLPSLAFAGQQDTYLNIIGDEALLDAVKSCWGSLWTARAMSYRKRNSISTDGLGLAVIVQKLIRSEVSGVLFTANPLTGRRDEMVIDASFGLGEAIVSGQVEPDHYEISSQDWSIRKVKLGSKSLAIRPQTEGGTEMVQEDKSHEQALKDEQILELAQMVQRVETLFGAAQDIEWAWAEGQFYLLQARPISSLYPLPRQSQADNSERVYVNFNAIQGVSDPLTPLGIDALRLMMSGIARMLGVKQPMSEVLPEAGSRLFVDFTAIIQDPNLRKIGLSILEGGEPAAAQTLLRLLEEGRIPTRKILGIRQSAALLFAGLPILARVLRAILKPDQVRERALQDADAYLLEVQKHLNSASTLAECIQAMEADLPHADRISIRIMPSVVPIISAAPPLLEGWLRNWLHEDEGAVLPLMRALPGNVTIEMNLKLWELAQAIRSNPESLDLFRSQSLENLAQAYRRGTMPELAQQGLEAFLEEYGMRGAAEIDLGHPKWRDEPGTILQILRSYLDLQDPQQAPDAIYQRGLAEAERLARDYVERSRKLPFGWLRAPLLAAVIHRLRTLGGLRELPLFYIARLFGIYREALLRHGKQLVESARLEQAEDIFFLTFDSLKRLATGEAIDTHAIVKSRRADYEMERLRRQMPRVMLGTGETFYEGLGKVSDNEQLLTGDAVSPGLVEGIARVVFDPKDAQLEAGEILVCPSTDPGWTPLFLIAGGLVMEIGGMVTHGSIVAREYGIPAVVGVHQATSRIQSGQRLRLDGSRGQITVLED